MRKSENISTNLTPEEKQFEQTLRPSRFKDFIGQQKITDNLKVFVSAAKKSGISRLKKVIDSYLVSGHNCV